MSLRPRNDVGETLAELLVAIALLGIAVVGLVGALGSSSLLSDIHRKDGLGDAALRNLAESVKAAAYVPCGGATPPSYTNPAGWTAATGFVASVSTPKYWTGVTPMDLTNSAHFASTCPSVGDRGLQLVTINLVSSDGRTGEATQVLKRDN